MQFKCVLAYLVNNSADTCDRFARRRYRVSKGVQPISQKPIPPPPQTKMESIQPHELRIGETYEIEFLNGSILVAKFTGIKGGYYYFLNKGHQFSIADNTIEYHHFYRINY
ncbi:MAG: hypothetical protein HC862_01645 [Scytonema sp. RU_4_4]|nr:hypothetical protein [Scytonema sp. RU_4_4]NJR75462.1 hypothetical protein [Scytonema sp. CRU_2_7]